ncbi:uncharacterized protein BDR25DRAFT_301121 [Lindgomyces ingoldianus]|uniref:Uncharacterized protein n=1 Tax=Lindgomyces ingoldianus TaxID=673940 RepID=A0ACB6RAV4_9PLEO|nr:uncharacterized protein BDR25DRAFT_301121 [Lindgomyces ingoldianus]KAF2475462.1 hypothetical protein BDR25DRAFT_301121 [Lindgomyces ingoldianus]
MTHDPYIIAQRNRKKAANLSRQSELLKERTENLGDPIRGNPTPFVESFETGKPLSHAPNAKIPQDEYHLNYALKPAEVEASLATSSTLAVPRKEQKVEQQPTSNLGAFSYDEKPQVIEVEPEDVEKRRQEDHARASIAIQRITSLENGSSKDRMRVNITRCVNTFGRHNTDLLLPPRAPGLPSVDATSPAPIRPRTNAEAAKKRIGPDTGSSEVQIAILTAKIKTLADFIETRGKGDKHNKRNLRLLVHRRQKLLQYLKRRERGGPRWEHCVGTLGLTEGMWKGEITL